MYIAYICLKFSLSNQCHRCSAEVYTRLRSDLALENDGTVAETYRLAALHLPTGGKRRVRGGSVSLSLHCSDVLIKVIEFGQTAHCSIDSMLLMSHKQVYPTLPSKLSHVSSHVSQEPSTRRPGLPGLPVSRTYATTRFRPHRHREPTTALHRSNKLCYMGTIAAE